MGVGLTPWGWNEGWVKPHAEASALVVARAGRGGLKVGHGPLPGGRAKGRQNHMGARLAPLGGRRDSQGLWLLGA